MMMAFGSNYSSVRTSNAYNSLVKELQQMWTEIGETEANKDRMLAELEQECLEIYRRKIDEAANAKACLHQSIAAREAEVAMLMATLGEPGFSILPEKKTKSLKGQLDSVTPLVEELKCKKEERMKQFVDIKVQIDKITSEMTGYTHNVGSMSTLNLEEQDLSVRKLMEYQSNLRALQKEKSERLQKVLDFVNEVHTLSGVLGLDFAKTVSEVHPSLHMSSTEHVTNISDSILEGLDQAVLRLKTQRKIRFQKLKDIAGSLSDLWNLMDTPKEDKGKAYFLRITSVLGSSESEIVQPGALSVEIIEQVSAEVERLTKLKAARLKELVLKRRTELEEICSRAHIQVDSSTTAEKTTAMVDSGLVDPLELLSNIEEQISKAENEASSRKELMDKINKWLLACDEEKWLETYNLDGSRYSSGKGAHINLKRAERARITVNKIPVMVDNLISKTRTWEDEKKMLFLYDGARLVSILEDYKRARQEKEEEKKHAKDQKKLHDMLLAEKESIYGSKPSPRRSNSFRTHNGYRSYGNGSVTPSPRRNSVGSPNVELLTPRSYSGKQNGYFKEMRRLSTAPLNFVAIQKEDTISFSSVYGSEPESPQLC